MGEKAIGLALIVTSGLMHAVQAVGWRIAWAIDRTGNTPWNSGAPQPRPDFADTGFGWLLFAAGVILLLVGFVVEPARERSRREAIARQDQP